MHWEIWGDMDGGGFVGVHWEIWGDMDAGGRGVGGGVHGEIWGDIDEWGGGWRGVSELKGVIIIYDFFLSPIHLTYFPVTKLPPALQN